MPALFPSKPYLQKAFSSPFLNLSFSFPQTDPVGVFFELCVPAGQLTK
jgi:hypothetical protein